MEVVEVVELEAVIYLGLRGDDGALERRHKLVFLDGAFLTRLKPGAHGRDGRGVLHAALLVLGRNGCHLLTEGESVM